MYYFLAAMMDSLYYIRVVVYQFYPSQLNIIIFLSQHPDEELECHSKTQTSHQEESKAPLKVDTATRVNDRFCN